ncbi:hypothetical protein, conserved [Eimeria maxima]|uniref:AAA+ ATPase domain-containing protein n=1 Tax=Eimeria maxima TaxID=5804 RepID=U6MCX4_EIMMA|nr:hypothetical protein, conserved [Eimeria maxima]CDJ60923.1 hypothetical protein, conserved [Eimeria maxima]
MRGFPPRLPVNPGAGPNHPLVHPSEEHSYSLFETDRTNNSNSGISSTRGGFEDAETGWEEREEELLVSLPPPSRSTFWMHLIHLKALCVRCIGKLFTSVFCRWCRSLQALDSSKLCPLKNFRCQPFKVGGAALLLVLLGARLWRLRGGRRMISNVSSRGPEVVPVHSGWHATRDRTAHGPLLWRLFFFWRLWRWPRTSAATEEPFSRVLDLVGRNAVKEVHFGPGSRLLLELKDKKKVVSSLVPGAEAAFFQAVSSRVPRFKAVHGGGLLPAVASFVAPLALMGLWFRLLRGLLLLQQPTRDSGTEREAAGAPPPTRFDEVISRQKEELQEIVCLLNGKHGLYNSMGARLPRGVLLVGPAGTGKTLLARAVAGETQAAFLSAAASEFTDIFVGQGARRVRELFRDARERAPCVVFIDELDALGCRSGCLEGAQATNQEYIQTINQLLAEIDGVMGAAAGVVLIAATNRLEAIDPALLRSGRFDRLIHLTLPDEDERLEILQLHATLKKLSLSSAARRHLKQVAAAAEGLSGADLENLLNESVFKAVRKGKTQVDEEALNEALITLLQRIQQARPPNERLGFSGILGCPV